MSKYFNFSAIVIAISFLLSACNGTKQTDTLPYSPYIEAFTSGTVPRNTPMYIVLAQEIPPNKIDTAALSKIITISPKREGKFAIEDNRHIVFFPKEGFDRGTTYNISVDLSKWFDNVKQKIFSFTFSTIPLELRASMESLDMSEDDNYNIVCNITTSDIEPPEVIQSLIELSESVDTTWSSTGRTHRLAISDIHAGKNGERSFVISTTRNKLGVPREELLSIIIPDIKEFSIYDMAYNTEPERYIEATFTSTIDPNQKMDGLVYLEGESSGIINVIGNKIRIYPGAELTGNVTVVFESTIRNNRGETLGEERRMTVNLKTETPAIRFTGKGVIIPRSGQLTIPFEAVYLRGVIVRVIQIKERNIGQFLQTNHLDGKSGLVRVGRLVARKTIFLDDDPHRLLYKWDTYSIDLSNLIEPEPGAIYRIELEYNRDLSAYPCDNAQERSSKELILANDEWQFKNELNTYDEAGSYYYYDDDYYDDYYYDSDYYKDPCQSSYYYYNTKVSRNVLATDLGVIAKIGTDNNMKVSIHNIVTTKPEKGVNIAIYNYQNDILGEGVSRDNGEANVALSPGKPYYLIASLGKQRSYMRLDDGSALSVSTFDVSGSVVRGGIKGYIYGERGVWRPGDTLHVAFMLNNSNASLPVDHPVTMTLYNPQGQLYTKKTETKGTLGIYRFDFPTDPDAPTGAWSVHATAGGASFSKTLRIETIKPNRLKIVLTTDDTPLLDDTSINTPLHVEWLHGATARNLAYEVDVSFSQVTTRFKGYDNFVFDSPVKSFSSDDQNRITGTTDEEGNALLSNNFSVGTSSPGMLSASFVTRVFEDSGDFSIDGFSKLFSPYENYIGIKKPEGRESAYGRLDTGSEYTYEVASVDYTGKSVSGRNIKVEVYKVTWYWWWSSYRSSLANYISNSYHKPVKELTLKTDSNGKGTFKLSFTDQEWGSYYISVTDEDGYHSSGVVSYFDWPYYSGQRDMDQSESANILTFKTDKTSYNIGEKIGITIPSSEGSRAIISIENGTRVVETHEFDCFGTESIFSINATADMQPGAYINITLLQPHANTENDMPVRLYGIVPITVTSAQSHLNPQITMADEIKPEANYQVTISEKDGREMAYTLAIVDEGLLDLTRFRTPDPWDTFNAREALGVRTWDMYNYIAGAYGGKVEQVFSIGGGGELEAGKKATVNRFKPVIRYAGPFILKKGQKQSHSFTMDNYNGRVRVMVVAGDGKAYGSTEKSVLVRKPVMLLGTLPRVIGIDEEMVIPATVFATEANVGNVSVTISCSDNMEIIGSAKQTLNFSKIEDKQTKFRIRVKGVPGAGKVTIVAQGKGDKSVYETEIEIRNVRRAVSRVVPVVLEAGKSWSDNLTLPGTVGTNNLTLEFSSVPPLNLSRRLDYLLGYPHGCIEQITSKSFPQLYLKQIANLTKKQEILADQAIKETIRRYRSYTTSEGGFAYWPGQSSPNEWGSIYAAHFIAEAEAKGYLVPENTKRSVVSYLQKQARRWQRENNRNYYRSNELTQAYRLYVLALHNSPEVGAMNRLRELDLSSETTKWMLAASYAMIGRKDVANGLISETKNVSDDIYDEYDYTYGSNLRDKAIRLQTLVLLERGEEAAVATKDIADVLSSDAWLSTQTTAFALMSASTYVNKYSVSNSMELSYKVANQSESVKISKAIWSTSIFENGANKASAELKNTGKSTVFARFVMEGIPEQGAEEAYSRGVKISVSYLDMNGKNIDITNLQQGTNFRAVVTVENPSGKTFKNLVLTEMFPSGWEIINTRYMGLDSDSDDSNSRYISYQDFRDDRVYSYIDYMPSGRSVTIRIDLTAVYAGKFYLPPVYCEAMYDNLIRANNEGKQVVVQ